MATKRFMSKSENARITLRLSVALLSTPRRFRQACVEFRATLSRSAAALSSDLKLEARKMSMPQTWWQASNQIARPVMAAA